MGCSKKILVMVLSAVLLCGLVSADTVIFKNGKRVKGLILEEFKDRVVVSTFKGEETVFKSDIRSVIYDDPDRALLLKARNLYKSGKYIKAYYAYEEIVEKNPGLQEARERLKFLRSYLETKTRHDIFKGVSRNRENLEGAEGKTPSERFKDEQGIVLVSGDRYVIVVNVANGSRGDAAPGLRGGDRIVSVWGEMTAYKDADEVAGMLLTPGEGRLVVERELKPVLSYSKSLLDGLIFSRYRNIIGGTLKLTKDGIVVRDLVPGGPFEKAGVMKGDLLSSVGGEGIRYTRISRIINFFRKNQGKMVEITIRRHITLWGKE